MSYKIPRTIFEIKLDHIVELSEQNNKDQRELVDIMKEYLETMQQIIKEIK